MPRRQARGHKLRAGGSKLTRDGLNDLVEDGAFWAAQARSLAVFASPARLQTFRLPNRLNSEVEVADRYYVKPLLRAVTFPQAAFVPHPYGRSRAVMMGTQARDRDHSSPDRHWATLSSWNPGKRSEAPEPLEARR